MLYSAQRAALCKRLQSMYFKGWFVPACCWQVQLTCFTAAARLLPFEPKTEIGLFWDQIFCFSPAENLASDLAMNCFLRWIFLDRRSITQACAAHVCHTCNLCNLFDFDSHMRDKGIILLAASVSLTPCSSEALILLRLFGATASKNEQFWKWISDSSRPRELKYFESKN